MINNMRKLVKLMPLAIILCLAGCADKSGAAMVQNDFEILADNMDADLQSGMDLQSDADLQSDVDMQSGADSQSDMDSEANVDSQEEMQQDVDSMQYSYADVIAEIDSFMGRYIGLNSEENEIRTEEKEILDYASEGAGITGFYSGDNLLRYQLNFYGANQQMEENYYFLPDYGYYTALDKVYDSYQLIKSNILYYSFEEFLIIDDKAYKIDRAQEQLVLCGEDPLSEVLRGLVSGDSDAEDRSAAAGDTAAKPGEDAASLSGKAAKINDADLVWTGDDLKETIYLEEADLKKLPKEIIQACIKYLREDLEDFEVYVENNASKEEIREIYTAVYDINDDGLEDFFAIPYLAGFHSNRMPPMYLFVAGNKGYTVVKVPLTDFAVDILSSKTNGYYDLLLDPLGNRICFDGKNSYGNAEGKEPLTLLINTPVVDGNKTVCVNISIPYGDLRENYYLKMRIQDTASKQSLIATSNDEDFHDIIYTPETVPLGGTYCFYIRDTFLNEPGKTDLMDKNIDIELQAVPVSGG